MPAPTATRSATDEVRHWAGRAMASPLELTVVTTGGRLTDDHVADHAWALVVDEFAAVDAALSRFRDDSEVTRLNQAALRGEAMIAGRRLAIAAHACDRAHRLTSGRFDPRVIDRLEAWGYAGATLDGPVGSPPVDPLAPIVERLDRQRIRLARPIDLGGIGKGLALRWASRRVRRAGIRRFVLDAGGDLVVGGPGPDGDPWRIGIEDPTGGAEPLAVIAVTAGAVATSSVKRLRWIADGRVRHHLVDPSTGEPADSGLLAVTVAAADPAWAEVWTKALFIAGRRRIGDEARARGLAAWWVASDGPLSMTPAARQRTIWVAGEG